MWIPAESITSGTPSPFRSATTGPRSGSRGGEPPVSSAWKPGAESWPAAESWARVWTGQPASSDPSGS